RQKETIKGIKVYRLPVWFKVSNTPINPLWYFEIKKIVARENPTIINGHAPVPFIADLAALASGNVPYVLTYHAGTMKKKKLFFDAIISIYEKILLKTTADRATKIVCSSDFVANTIMKPYVNKSTIINPSVDTSFFKPIKNLKKKKNRVLFVGRSKNMYQMKGLPVLAAAVSKIPNAKLRVIGERDRRSGANIEFAGIKTGKDLVRELSEASVLALPSLQEVESFGTVLIEAMACKTPVVGSNTGAIPKIIENGVDGMIVPPNNINKLSNALKKIIEDGRFRARMASYARKKAEKYDVKYQVNLTSDVLSSIL
ncbi:MAG TPA: glycosyltransferase family 4 protein, partial [Patescibacteria group bacterium]|nr:glycosyltransferase family 4 protein [Patescibacteria group bacterium]